MDKPKHSLYRYYAIILIVVLVLYIIVGALFGSCFKETTTDCVLLDLFKRSPTRGPSQRFRCQLYAGDLGTHESGHLLSIDFVLADLDLLVVRPARL